MCPLKKPLPLFETFDNDGVGLGVRGDVLYMVYTDPILTYASAVSETAGVHYSTVKGVTANGVVGLDVAVMYTMPNQPGYSFEMGWYHITPTFSSSLSETSPSGVAPAHSVALNGFAPGTGKVHASLSINFFDLVIKKQFSFGDWVHVTPTAGFVGGYMNGKSSAHFDATSGTFQATPTATVTHAILAYQTKYEGIGLKLGADAAFMIGSGFRLITNFYYNVLYGFSHLNLDYVQSPGAYIDGLTGAVSRYTQHHGRDFFDALLGFAWASHFSDESFYLDLHAGWRFQTFANGWQEFEAEFNNAARDHALQGQGLQAGVTFRF